MQISLDLYNCWEKQKWCKLIKQCSKETSLEHGLQQIDINGTGFNDLDLLESYAYYKLGKPFVLTPGTDVNRENKLAKLLFNAAKESNRLEILHLAAQWAFASADYWNSLYFYNQIWEKFMPTEKSEKIDLLVNTLAAQSQTRQSSVKNLFLDEIQDYNVLFNRAFIALNLGYYKTALTHLEQGLSLIIKDQFATKQEYISELLPFLIQQLYIHILQEDKSSIARLEQQIILNLREIDQTSLDANLATIIENNMCMRESSAIARLEKMSKLWSCLNRSKLLKWQNWAMQHNQNLTRLQITKVENFSSKYNLASRHIWTLKLFEKYQQKMQALQGPNPRKHRHSLQSMNMDVNKKIALLLAAVQHEYKTTKDFNKAKLLFERRLSRIKNKEIKFSPGIISIRYVLNQQLGLYSVAKRVLFNAAAYWRKNSDFKDYNSMASILKQNILVKLADGQSTEKVIQDLDLLQRVNPFDTQLEEYKTIFFDNDEYILDEIKADISEVDIEKLERIGVKLHADKALFHKAKRRRKHIKPKNMKLEIDPERWIKKCARTKKVKHRKTRLK